jgi:ferredoxin-thioredoxin reductase catalytic subunit
MPHKELGRRLRLSIPTQTALENKLRDEGRNDDLSPYVDEICKLFLGDELVRIRPDIRERLLAVRAALKRRDDIGQFIEWICELFLTEHESGHVGVAAEMEKLPNERQRQQTA